jgi:hypothetical protein
MTLIDSRGRLFGRINLVDAVIIGFLLVLIPLGYGTYLLFRPAKPRIDSVVAVPFGKEERRLASGAELVAKLKVKGAELNPLLRAYIGSTPALAFVFENPSSADVLVGDVKPDDADVILYDGVQEVARASGAFKPPSTPVVVSQFVRGVGRLIDMDPVRADGLKLGLRVPADIPDFEILALGPAQPGRARSRFGPMQVERDANGLMERDAVLRLRCDPSRWENACAVGERLAELGTPSVQLSLKGEATPFAFVLADVLPDNPGTRARIQVRFAGGGFLASAKTGDRDTFLDERAAVITGVTIRTAESLTATLDLGLDESRGGWRYRAQRIKPGSVFVFTTDRYEAIGRVETVDLIDPAKRGGS